MNTITRQDKHCNSYEEALLSKTFRFVFFKTLKKCGGKNQKILQNIFDRFISQEPISDEEKEIFNAFLNDRDVKIHAEKIRQQIDFSRMSEQEKKEIMEDFTSEHLINTLQNKISGEVFLTLDNKAVEVLKRYGDLQVLSIYKNKVPYYAIKKVGEELNSSDFIFTGEHYPKMIENPKYGDSYIFFGDKGDHKGYIITNGVTTSYAAILDKKSALFEDNGECFYDCIVTDMNGNFISEGVVILGNEFNEDGTIKYINLDNIPKSNSGII